jgi:hypothetical protein
LKFINRKEAEKGRKELEQNFKNKVKVLWADRDGIPISVHLSFDKNKANENMQNFNKDVLLEFFTTLIIHLNSDDIIHKKEEYKKNNCLLLSPTFGCKKSSSLSPSFDSQFRDSSLSFSNIASSKLVENSSVGSCFPIQIGLPRNNLFYKGYATLTFPTSFAGFEFYFFCLFFTF